jgi:hypothetical protein
VGGGTGAATAKTEVKARVIRRRIRNERGVR